MAERTRYRSVVADSSRWDGFEFRPGDIVISTPPKCGTTWMQRLVALLVFDGPELPAPLAHVSPWLDMQLAPRDEIVTRLEGLTHRRFMKTHTPLDGLPYDPSVRYVCVGRDPRDVAVSGRHHMANMDVDQFLGRRAAAVGLDDLPELGLDKPGPAEPLDARTGLLSWIADDSTVTPMTLGYTVRHLRSFWDNKHLPNVGIFHYHDLLNDLPGQLRRLGAFLGYDVDEGRAAALAEHASFDAMRGQAEQVAPNADISLWRNTTDFFHRGTSGQWRDAFDAEALERYDERMRALATPDLESWLHSGWLGLPEQRAGTTTPPGNAAPEI